MKWNLVPTALAAIVLAICYLPVIADQTEKSPMQTTQKPVFRNAQDYIEYFRQGGKYYDTYHLPGLMIGTQPDPKAMKALGEALATEGRDVRKNIIHLLDDIRHLSHPGYELRSPEIIGLLVGPGFAKSDGARDDAIDLLRRYASVATLSRYGDVFLKILREDPENIDIRIIAKAKPKSAWEEVDRLSKLPGREGVRLARAALGDRQIEDEYIAVAKCKEEAGDMDGLVASFRPLAEIGTRRTLQMLCRYVRSPLIQNIAGIEQVSMRLNAMSALIYAFPEAWPLLDSSAVKSDEDYIRAEQFCVKVTGVSYDGMPRPPFFTTMPYPRFH